MAPTARVRVGPRELSIPGGRVVLLPLRPGLWVLDLQAGDGAPRLSLVLPVPSHEVGNLRSTGLDWQRRPGVEAREGDSFLVLDGRVLEARTLRVRLVETPEGTPEVRFEGDFAGGPPPAAAVAVSGSLAMPGRWAKRGAGS